MAASILILLFAVVVVAVIVIVLGLALNVRRGSRRPVHAQAYAHAGPYGAHGAAWHGAQRATKEPSIRVGRLILAILFFPIVMIVWALASLGDLIEAAVHLCVGAIEIVVAVIESLTGSKATKQWTSAGRELGKLGKNVYSMGRRFVEYVGFGGFLDRVEDGIREASGRRGPLAPTPPVVEATGAFPFEDRFRIEGHLAGGGSTARLFIVRRLERDRPVGDRLVLKYFDMGMGSRLEEVLRESRGMQVAREMGIVLDHDLGPDHFYYVMPYYEGETLTRAAARIHRRLLSGQGMEKEDVETCLDWMGQMLRILDAYHRRGVIHKDVKPDNLIVTDEGVRLVDLGLMTPVESALTLTTHGTEYFRDPEMVKLAVAGKRVRDVDAVRFDVYSSGAVLYLLLEGSFPACGPLSRFSRPMPMALSYVTSRAMAEGGKRYPTIATMRADLEAFRALMRYRDVDDIPVSSLPSFGSLPTSGGLENEDSGPTEQEVEEVRFEASHADVEPPPPSPPLPPPPPLVAAEPVAAALEPRRRSRSTLTFVLLAMMLLAVLAAAGAYVLLVRRPGSPPRPLTDAYGRPIDASSHEHEIRLDPGKSGRIVQWLRAFLDGIREKGHPVPEEVSVLVVAGSGEGLEDLEHDVRRTFSREGVAVETSRALRERVRSFLAAGGRTPAEVHELALRETPGRTTPFVVWMTPSASRTSSTYAFADVTFYALGDSTQLTGHLYGRKVRR